jgi:tetratricopeptide (TPR) repeat protein
VAVDHAIETMSSRLDDLKRRVQQDPASIAFAALAEEYRRAGRYREAIDVCRAGLLRHPAYLSARVTLGRALLEVGELEEGREHLEQVLKIAPENLAAIRALAEIHRRRAEFGTTEAADLPLSSDDAPADTASTSPAPAPPIRLAVATGPAVIVRNDGGEEQAALARLDAFLGAIGRARATLDAGRYATLSG